MGLRLFRRIKIAPGISINLSKSGLSASAGVRGARVTLGPRGVRRTVGIPGTGIYYTENSSLSGSSRTRTSRARTQRPSDSEAHEEVSSAQGCLTREPQRVPSGRYWGRISEIKVVDPRKGALTQIFEEFRPEGVPVVIENVVEQVDSLVSPVRGTGWQSSHPGDRRVRQELHLVLKNNGLPISGELFDRAYAYISENY